jgi:hypothetical protein
MLARWVLYIKCRYETISPPYAGARPGETGKEDEKMKISIDSQYAVIGGKVIRNYTSCGDWWYGYSSKYKRINVWPLAIWIERGTHGISIGDAAYYKRYADCPTILIRLYRWIGYKSGAYPSASRPYAE